ncbi:MAG: hypothetical protein AABX75_02685 [Nanoarchaeota archaeon]
MAQVNFKAAGTGNATAVSSAITTLTPSWPAVSAGNLALVQVVCRNLTMTPTTPAGFSIVQGPITGSTCRQWIMGKICDGTETGNLSITVSTSTLAKMARIYAFENNATASYTEGATFSTGAVSSSISARPVTTLDKYRLAVTFVAVSDDNALSPFVGETGGDWTEATPEFTTTQGLDGALQLQIAIMASSGTITGGVSTMIAADPWILSAFAIIPASTAAGITTRIMIVD